MQLVLVFCSVAILWTTCWANNEDKNPEVDISPAPGNFLNSRLRRFALLKGLGLGDDKKPKRAKGPKKLIKTGDLLGDIIDGPSILKLKDEDSRSIVKVKDEDSKESTEQQTKQDVSSSNRQSKSQGIAVPKSTTEPSTTEPPTTEPSTTTAKVVLSTSTPQASKEPSTAGTTVQEPSTTVTTTLATSTASTTVQEPSTTVTTTLATSSTAKIVQESSTTETTTQQTSTVKTTTGVSSTTEKATGETLKTEGALATTLAPNQVSTSEGSDATATESADTSGSMKLVKSESRSQAGSGAGQESRSIGEMGNLFKQKYNQIHSFFFDESPQAPSPPQPENLEDPYANLPPVPSSPPASSSLSYKEIIRQLPDHQKLPEPSAYMPESTKYMPESSKYMSESTKYMPEPSKYMSESSKYMSESSKYMPEASKYMSESSSYLSESSAYLPKNNKPIPSPYSTYLDKKTGSKDFDTFRPTKLPTVPTMRPSKPVKMDYDGDDPFFAG